MSTEHLLAYDAPASQWLEALPLGNGRLGAMVFGGRTADRAVDHRFQLNDSSAWSGSPHSQDRDPVFGREEAGRILGGSRRLISDGDFAGAAETLKGLQHRHSQAYLPFADLHVTVSPGASPPGPVLPPSDYHRGLDLAVRLDSPLRLLRASEEEGSYALELKLPSDAAPAHDGGLVEYAEDDALSLQGAVAMAWEHDGQPVQAVPGQAGQEGHDAGLAATGVRRADLYVTTATTFAGLAGQPQGSAATAAAAARTVLDQARASGRAALQARHGDSHSRLYQASGFELNVPAWEGRIQDGGCWRPTPTLAARWQRTPDWRRCCSTTAGTC